MTHLSGRTGIVYVADLLISDCEVAWDTGTNGTASLETTLVKVGDGSAKCVIAALGAAGDIVMYDTITAVNVSAYTHILCWARSTVTSSAADLVIGLGTAAAGATPTSQVNLPALTANTWKYCHCTEVAGKTLDDTTAGTIIGLELNVDFGAPTVYLDDIRAAKTVAGIRSWTLDYTVDTIDTTDFTDGGATNAPRSFLPGLSSWSGSFEGVKDGAPLTIFSQVGLELAESATVTQMWLGNVILTGIHPNVAADGLVTYTYDYQGVGELMEASA